MFFISPAITSPVARYLWMALHDVVTLTKCSFEYSTVLIWHCSFFFKNRPCWSVIDVSSSYVAALSYIPLLSHVASNAAKRMGSTINLPGSKVDCALSTRMRSVNFDMHSARSLPWFWFFSVRRYLRQSTPSVTFSFTSYSTDSLFNSLNSMWVPLEAFPFSDSLDLVKSFWSTLGPSTQEFWSEQPVVKVVQEHPKSPLSSWYSTHNQTLKSMTSIQTRLFRD